MPHSARQWTFRIVSAIVIPLVLVIALEGGLRLFGYGHPAAFTVPCTIQGHGAYCDNDRFTWQFFPPGAFRLPPPFAIPGERSPETFRIFIVGESAAQGDPDPSFSFSRYLDVMLRERYPAVRFEVINTGISSINSHVLLPLVRDLASHQPDLFILYIGNNEVVGPYGAGTTLTARGASLPLIRASIALKSTRLGQFLDAALRPDSKQNDPWAWRGMEMFLDQQVPADAPALAQVYENFHSNLRDIVAAARDSGAPVLLCTVGVNLKDSAPFASQHRAGLSPEAQAAWDAQLQQGKSLEAAGQQAEALQRYLAAAAIDDRHAELQFRIGRLHWALGEFEAARQNFLQARDLDALRFRADGRLNEITRSVAQAAGPGVELVDAEQIFAQASPHGVTGGELFYEHVHMNPAGNYVLARALYERIAALLPESMRGSAAIPQAPSQEQVEALLALTPFDRHRIARDLLARFGRPPFTNQLNHADRVRELQRQVDIGNEDPERSAATYHTAIDRRPDDRWLHYNNGVFLEQRDPVAAAAEFRRVLDILPRYYEAREKLADALIKMGKFDEAVAECREILHQMPYHPPAYLTMAYALAQQGAFDESVAAYEQAIQVHPPYAVDAYNQIGIIQLHQSRFDRAAESFEKALKAGANQAQSAEILYNLSLAFEKLGRGPEARRAREAAIASLRQP